TSGTMAQLYLRPASAQRRAVLAPFALAIVLGAAGPILAQIQWDKPHGQPMLVRLVQGNIPQSQKFDPLLINQGMLTYQHMAAMPPHANGRAPDLVVLPETVIPVP